MKDEQETTSGKGAFVSKDRQGLWRLSRKVRIALAAVVLLVVCGLALLGWAYFTKEPAPDTEVQTTEPEEEWSQIFHYKPEEQQ